MPSNELRALADKLKRPAQAFAELDALPASSLQTLLDRVEAVQAEEAAALQAARQKAFPPFIWRLLLTALSRESA